MNKWKRIASLVITGMLALCYMSTALAATVSGGTITQYNGSYLVGQNGTPLSLDKVTLSVDAGVVAYVLDPTLVSTRPDATYDAYVESNAQFMTGVKIIMQYGYPLNLPANIDSKADIANDKARYATAVAVAAWAIHCGAPAPAGWVDFLNNPEQLGAAEGCEAVESFMLDLLSRAKAQAEMPHEIRPAAEVVKLTQNSDGTYTAQVPMTLINSNGGYTLDASALPRNSKVAGFTGKASETLIFTLPSDTASSYTLKLTAKDTRVNSNYEFYTSTNQDAISKLVAMKKSSAPQSVEVSAATLVLSKTEGVDWTTLTSGDSIGPSAGIPDNTGLPISKGAPYKVVEGCIVMYEKDAAELTPIPGAMLEISNAAGQPILSEATDANGCIDIRRLNPGKYTYKQLYAAEGYAMFAETMNVTIQRTSAGIIYGGDVIAINDIVRVPIKVVAADSTPVKVAELQIKKTLDPSAVIMTVTTNDNGLAEFSRLAPDNYTITVSKLASGKTPEADSLDVSILNTHINQGEPYEIIVRNENAAKTGVEDHMTEIRLIFVVSIVALAALLVVRTIKAKYTV